MPKWLQSGRRTKRPGVPTDEEWDFYPCVVDDASASISTNLALIRSAPVKGFASLHWIGLEMLEPGPEGLGMSPDVQRLWEIEDRILAAAAEQGLLYVGRVRNHGDWQLCFYGMPEDRDHVDRIAVDGLAGERRGYRVGTKEDPEWSYYREFLYPPPERMQWIMDRRVVDDLVKHGDSLEAARPVDHFVYFPEDIDTEPFKATARSMGFAVTEHESDPNEHPRCVELQRAESLEGMRIHQVVMDLLDEVEKHGGQYDGWGCPVVKPS